MDQDDDKGKGRRQGKGKGEGPIGKPYKEVESLVDLALDEGFEIFGKVIKARKKVDRILDTLEEKETVKDVDFGKGTISTTGRPYDHPKKVRVVADVEECDMQDGEGEPVDTSDLSFDGEEEVGDDYADAATSTDSDEPNDIAHVPADSGEEVYDQVKKQMSEIRGLSEDDKATYKAYFQKMLKKYGVNSPAELGDKKKEFFNAVDKGWKGVKEGFDKNLN